MLTARWSHAHPAAPLEDGARELGVAEEQVRRLLGRRRTHHEPAFDGPRESTRRTEEQIIADLRAFHAATVATTCQAFTAWAREQGVPGHQTAAIRFGTWNEALSAAGVGEETGAPRSAFRDEDLWAAVLAAVQAENGGTTFRAAEEWLAVHPAAPSGALIRGHEGGCWSETATITLAVLREPDTFDPVWVQDVTAPRGWDADPAQEDPLDHVRAAIAALGPRITTARYAAWARENRRPTVATLQRRTGTVWTAILAAAGGEPNAAKVKNRSRAEVREYVRRFLAAHPTATTVEYARWAPRHGAPSLTTVIGRYGTWSGALEACR